MISAKYLLFDLDGTLIDPKLGITRSILYALEKMGTPSSPDDSLDWCIGPPLHLSMRKLLSSTDESMVERAVGFFAERFETIGKYEASIYPGTMDALGRIQALGQRMYVATAKPQFVASDIINHFGLEGYFDGVYGSLHDKAALLARILELESINPAEALMIGDREHDIISAQKCSMRSVAVTYGYGSGEELKAAGPDYLFNSLAEFVDTLVESQR